MINVNDTSSSSCRIRNRYLSKLGILPPTGKPKIATEPSLRWRQSFGVDKQLTATDEPSRGLPEEVPELSLRGLAFLDSQSMSSLTCDWNSFYDDEGEEEDKSGFGTVEGEVYHQEEKEEEEDPNRDDRTNRVQFHTTVAVYEIPSHKDYDETTHRALWNSQSVQELKARINTLEFWADQRDWKNAREEKDFVKTPTGELVHPATWKLISEHMALCPKNEGPQNQRRKTPPRRRKPEAHKHLVCVGGAPSLTRFADS